MQAYKSLRRSQTFISSRRVLRRGPLQGDVQEERQGEEWSDTGRHPHQHLPAANVMRLYQTQALSHTCCQLLISIYRINHSNLCHCLNPSVGITSKKNMRFWSQLEIWNWDTSLTPWGTWLLSLLKALGCWSPSPWLCRTTSCPWSCCPPGNFFGWLGRGDHPKILLLLVLFS